MRIRRELGAIKIILRFYLFYLITRIRNFRDNNSVNIKKKKLVWFGAYGNTNIGDDLIFFALKQFVPEDVEIELSCRQKEPTTNYGVKTFYFNNKYHNLIKKSDVVLLGGGGLFEYYKGSFYSFSIIKYIYPLLIAKYYKKKYAIIGMGCNVAPLPNPVIRRVFKYVISKSEFVITRDQKSYKGFVNNGGTKGNIIMSYDPVFNLPLIKYKLDNKCNKVVVGFLIWPFYLHPHFHTTNQIDKLIEVISNEKLKKHNIFLCELKNLLISLEKLNIKVTFPIFHFSDKIILEQLGYSSDVKISYDSYIEHLNTCSVIVSMRYHGQITAIANNIPVVSIVVQEKMEALVHNFGIEDYAQYIDQFNAEKCKNQIVGAINNSTNIKKQLNEKFNSISSEVNITYSQNLNKLFS